ncbi:hypothetical protein SUDANB95_02798 [Actinosynnema sp. ALI-1.44]
MVLGDDAVDLVVDCVRRMLSGVPQPPAVAALYGIVEGNALLAPVLHELRSAGEDVERLERFRHTLRRAAGDPGFARALTAQLEQFRAEPGGVRQQARVEGTVNGTVEIVQAGRDVLRAKHIGDRIKNVYQTRQGRIGLAAAAAALVILVVTLVTLPSTGSPAPRSTGIANSDQGPRTDTRSPTPSTNTSSSTAAPAVAAGTILHSGDNLVVRSNGRIAVTAAQDKGRTTTLTTIDIASGKKVGGLTLRAFENVRDKCDYSVIRGQGSMDLVLYFERTAVAARGTVPSEVSRALVALNAADGTVVWRTEPRKDPRVTSEARTYTSCDGALPDGSVTADHRHAWFRHHDGDEPFAVDLRTGRMRPQPGTLVVGNHVAVPGPLSETRYGSPAHVDLVDPATGSSAGRIGDPELGSAVVNSLVAVSPDGRSFVHAGPGGEGYVARSLPDLGVLWQRADDGTNMSRFRVDVTAGVVVGGWPALSGLSLATGEKLWTVPAINYFCGVDAGRAYVVANDQFAVVDLASGNQLEFDASMSQCPSVLPGVMVKGGRLVKL